MRPQRLVLLLAVAFAAVAYASWRSATPVRLVTLGVPGHSNATPSVAADGQLVAVAWTAATAGGADVYTAVSHDAGRSFGEAVRVNDVAGSVRSAGEQAPQIVFAQSGLVVVWNARAADASEIRMAASRDDGRSFGPSVRI